jgi:hypothetical protein
MDQEAGPKAHEMLHLLPDRSYIGEPARCDVVSRETRRCHSCDRCLGFPRPVRAAAVRTRIDAFFSGTPSVRVDIFESRARSYRSVAGPAWSTPQSVRRSAKVSGVRS